MTVVRFLSSSKLAAWLIGALLALCLVSFVVPQRSHAALSLYNEWAAANPFAARTADALGLDDIFVAPAFVALLGLLALNLSACTVDRLSRRGRARVRVPKAAPAGAEGVTTTLEPDQIEYALLSEFRFWGRRTAEHEGVRYILLDRGALGFTGSVIMHTGILLLLIAGVVSSLTRFDGRLVLTVSETTADVAEAYYGQTKEPTLGRAYDGSTITLESLDFEYEDGYITQAHGWLTFRDGTASKLDEAVVNGPARWHGKSYLMVRGGHAVRLSIADAQGATLFEDTSVRLGNAVDGGYADEIVLPDGRRIELYSTADAGDSERATSEPLRLGDPAVLVRLSESRQEVLTRPGARVTLGDLQVSVDSVSLWNEFAVRGDRGIPVAYASFGVILLGTAIRFAFDKRRLGCLIIPEDGGTQVLWWSSEASAARRVRAALASTEVEQA
jgi:cytochrome c biogenesis protein ResB